MAAAAGSIPVTGSTDSHKEGESEALRSKGSRVDGHVRRTACELIGGAAFNGKQSEFNGSAERVVSGRFPAPKLIAGYNQTADGMAHNHPDVGSIPTPATNPTRFGQAETRPDQFSR